MKQTFTLFIFIFLMQDASACLGASQNRLFPLGTSSKGFLVVETHLRRSEFEYDEGIGGGWSGKGYFKVYDQDYKEIYSELLDEITPFDEKKYEERISITFAKRLQLAKKYAKFVPAKPVSMIFCDYTETCSLAGIVYDSLARKISIRFPDGREHEVKLLKDTTSIASNMMGYFMALEDIDWEDAIFTLNLYINSVREFNVGERKLTVVHIGTGQIIDLEEGETYPAQKEYKPDFEFTELTKSTFEEPVMHHGTGFDFYIWN